MQENCVELRTSSNIVLPEFLKNVCSIVTEIKQQLYNLLSLDITAKTIGLGLHPFSELLDAKAVLDDLRRISAVLRGYVKARQSDKPSQYYSNKSVRSKSMADELQADLNVNLHESKYKINPYQRNQPVSQLPQESALKQVSMGEESIAPIKNSTQQNGMLDSSNHNNNANTSPRTGHKLRTSRKMDKTNSIVKQIELHTKKSAKNLKDMIKVNDQCISMVRMLKSQYKPCRNCGAGRVGETAQAR